MKYALMITGAPESGALSKAYQFAQDCLSAQNTINIVFFYQDAVRVIEQETEHWDALKLPTHLCSTSVHKNNLLEPKGFIISGLGSWAQAMMEADEVVVFGGGHPPPSLTLPRAAGEEKTQTKTLVALVTIPPEPYERSEALLNQLLAYAAFELPLTIVFQGAGLLQLLEPRLGPQWTMLPDYDVTELYTTEKTLKEQNLTLSEIPLPLKIITLEEINNRIESAHWVVE